MVYISVYCLCIPIKIKDLQAWNNCSLVLPILEYCCLNIFCKPSQLTFISLSDSYHNLASPTKVKWNLCTLTWSRNLCVSIQLFVLSRCASESSPGLLAYSGLKWDQFNCGLWDSAGTKEVLGIKGMREGGAF